MDKREAVLDIFRGALDTVLPVNLIREALRLEGDDLVVEGKRYRLDDYRRIFIFGSGKASLEMAKAAETILGERVSGGLVVGNYEDQSLRRVRTYASSHPIPTEKSIEAAEMLSSSLASLDDGDLYLYLLSGGNSALVEKPIPPVTLGEIQEMIKLLLNCGAPIEEMNMVRKHLSTVKGGRLGRFARARGIVLVVSDVIGDDLEAIGSAPLFCDSSSYQDVAAIFSRYELWENVPASIASIIKKGLLGEIEETPKQPSPLIDHFIIGSNLKLLVKGKERAQALGFKTAIMTSRLRGEAREAAKAVLSLGEEIANTGNPFAPPVCLLFGGETTVTVRGRGRGGRNQEMCLSLLKEMKGDPRFCFLSAGTDGIDGASDAAGAVVDKESYRIARELSLNFDTYLGQNNSYEFLKKTGDLIITGPTGTNVIDMSILIVTKDNGL